MAAGSTNGQIREVSDRLIAMSYEERVAQPCIGRDRADLVLAGCAILEAILQDVALRSPARRRPGPARGHARDHDGRGRHAPPAPPPLRSAVGWRPVKKPGRGRQGRRGGKRRMAERLKTARGRTPSQQKWLRRQLNDPYVAAAREQGYRSRAAFKLAEIDERYHLLKHGMRVLDLGATPGGWSQVAAEAVGAGDPVAARARGRPERDGGAARASRFCCRTFSRRARRRRSVRPLGGPADAVLSDMAAPATGHRQTDHLRIMALCEAAVTSPWTSWRPAASSCARCCRAVRRRRCWRS